MGTVSATRSKPHERQRHMAISSSHPSMPRPTSACITSYRRPSGRRTAQGSKWGGPVRRQGDRGPVPDAWSCGCRTMTHTKTRCVVTAGRGSSAIRPKALPLWRAGDHGGYVIRLVFDVRLENYRRVGWPSAKAKYREAAGHGSVIDRHTKPRSPLVRRNDGRKLIKTPFPPEDFAAISPDRQRPRPRRDHKSTQQHQSGTGCRTQDVPSSAHDSTFSGR